MTAIVVIALYEAAYIAEALRSGVNAVAMGQGEAARALGLTFGQSLRHVILPQALRTVIQPIGNIFIALAMNTSLAGAVGVVDLTAAANRVNLMEAQPIPIFVGAGLAYALIAACAGLRHRAARTTAGDRSDERVTAAASTSRGPRARRQDPDRDRASARRRGPRACSRWPYASSPPTASSTPTAGSRTRRGRCGATC